jgi:hypothetical protein
MCSMDSSACVPFATDFGGTRTTRSPGHEQVRLQAACRRDVSPRSPHPILAVLLGPTQPVEERGCPPETAEIEWSPRGSEARHPPVIGNVAFSDSGR